VFSIKSLTARATAWDIGNSTGNQAYAFDINTFGTSGQKFGFYASAAAFDSSLSTNLNQNLLSLISNNSQNTPISSNTFYYINNTQSTSFGGGAIYPNYGIATRISIGNFNGVNTGFNGAHQEFISYPTNQSTNRIAIASNINSYYSIY
jgi:hypothetical protein